MLLGLVGKPSCGKSTFFKACTLADVAIASYPFTTIKPNHGVGYVRVECIDKEFNTQCMPRTGYCVNHIRFVPVEIMDVAGLVKGASEGKGLGNQFLDDLRQADCFIHIVDVSGETDEGGKPTKGYNPVEDIEMLEKELDLWYAGILKKVWRTFARTVENTKENFAKAVAKQFSGLKVTEEDVKQILLKFKFNVEKPASWSDDEILRFSHELRHLTKPMIIAANKIDKEAEENLRKLRREYSELMIIPCSADSELALREAVIDGLIDYVAGDSEFKIKSDKLNERQKKALEFIKKFLEKWQNTGVQEVLNKAVFEFLKNIVVYPVENEHKFCDSKGNILPDAYLLPQNSTALDLAFHIHTDIGNKFISAIDCRTGKRIGKETKLKNNDVIKIITR